MTEREPHLPTPPQANPIPPPTSSTQTNQDSMLILSREDLVTSFTSAKRLVSKVESSELAATDIALQELVEQGVRVLETIEEGIRRLEIFSKNEHAADVHTEDLEFVLCEVLLGNLYLKRPAAVDKTLRLKNLQRALVCFEKFIENCERLQLVDAAERKGVDAVINGRAQDAASRREMKIERYNRTRECKKQLEKVEQDLEKQRKQESVDEELLRERVLLVIANAIREVLENYGISAEEKTMLEQIIRMERLSPGQAASPKQPPKESQGITVTKVDKQFNVTRETLKAGVFKPSWRQPTVSLEEYAEIEVARAKERAAREAEAAQEEPERLKYEQLVERGLEDDEKLLDKATTNDRKWDDWKDDHPKGSAVTKRY